MNKNSKQLTNHVLMIKPQHFHQNKQTFIDNQFQQQVTLSTQQMQLKALQESQNFRKMLINEGIKVTYVEDQLQEICPDSIFPNNWVSFHHKSMGNSSYVIYAMMAQNRRAQRELPIFKALTEEGMQLIKTYDYSHYQAEGKFLQGTGSIILDKDYLIAYGCISPRTNQKLFYEFCKDMSYKPILFKASIAPNQSPVYHTNVIMSLSTDLVILCTNSICQKDRSIVLQSLQKSNKKIIEISKNQAQNFVGNTLFLSGNNKLLAVMSTTAYNILQQNQIDAIQQRYKIIKVPLNVIEKCGGGSARCMLAQIF